jgi:group II intron reverse transcriptase/maturase
MDLISQVADLNHLAQVFSHYQQRHRTGSHRGRLRPGSDGETLVRFADQLDRNLHLISDSLLAGQYSFSPFVERRITLTGGTARTVSTATVRDTIVQKALALVVEPELDSLLVENCYSFRLGKEAPTIHDAITAVVRYHGTGRYWVVKEDISSYFDNLDHGLLLARLEEALPSDLSVASLYRSYVKAPRLADGIVVPRQRGVPLGSVLANCLSNLYLTPLDMLMGETGHLYLRYCDDIIVFAESQSQAQEAREAIADLVARLGLTLNSRKSSLLPPGGRFVHLGYEFDGQRVRIGARALNKFKARIRGAGSRQSTGRLTSRALHSDEGRTVLRQVIAQVNKEICGDTPRNWARYFARCDFDDQFRGLDFWIRDRVRAAVTKRWNKGNYRAVPTPLLQELGLRSLVGEYYTWRNRWRHRDQSLIQAIARLDRLRDVLESYRQRYYKPLRGTYDFRPGADGVTLEQFISNETSNLRLIQDLLLGGGYQFTPFIEYTRAKRARSDDRVICRASLADTVVQKAVAQVLDRKFDHVLGEQCYSYRRGRSQFGAVGQVLARVNARADWWVVRSDFSSFLDTVNLPILVSQLEGLLVDEPLVLDLYLKYLYNGRVRDGRFLPRTSGLPRGGILTPFLANLYLTPLDDAMEGEGFHYTRYADDIIVLAETEQRARQVLKRIDQLSGKLDLIQSPEKRKILPPGEGFEFLGYQIKGSEVSIRPYAINSLKRRIRRVTDKRKYPQLDAKSLSTEEGRAALQSIIARVNRTYVYRGGSDWARHFCRCSSDRQLRELDSWIADRLRMAVTKRWATKNRRFIPYRLLRELGWQPLVPLYYRWRREVWRQGARSSQPLLPDMG